MAMTHPTSDGVEYQQRVDEDLVAIAKTGDNLAMEYLLNKYKNFVRIKAKSYFLIGADREDIIQEGMIGLYKAVRDFKADKLSSFRAFAELCITRQIITAIKTATRQKHIPLNQYISLNKPIYDEDSERTLLDVMASQKTSDPEELVVTQEVSDDIRQRIRQNLSELESQVLESYLEGKSYQEMARDLGRHVKSIDNALAARQAQDRKESGGVRVPIMRSAATLLVASPHSTGAWTTGPALPVARSEVAVAALAIACSSSAVTPKATWISDSCKCSIRIAACGTTSSRYRADSITLAAVGYNGQIYVFGGFAAQNAEPVNDADVYDPSTNRWSPIAPLPRALGSISVAVLGDEIHLVGGRGAHSVREHLVYDPSATATVRAPRFPSGAITWVSSRTTTGSMLSAGASIRRRIIPHSSTSTTRKPMRGLPALRCRRRAAGWPSPCTMV